MTDQSRPSSDEILLQKPLIASNAHNLVEAIEYLLPMISATAPASDQKSETGALVIGHVVHRNWAMIKAALLAATENKHD